MKCRNIKIYENLEIYERWIKLFEKKADDKFEDVINDEKKRTARRPVFAENPSPARRLAEGAMLVASAVIFGLSAAYLPLLWLVAIFLLPVPIALMVRRFGVGFGFCGILATAVIMSLFVGPLAAVSMLVLMGGVGFWYGYAARQKFSPWMTLVVGVVFAAMGMATLLVLSSVVSGIGIADFTAQVHNFVEFYVNNMQQRGQLSEILGSMTVEEFTAALEQRVLNLLPASLIMMSMISAGVAYALNSYVFKRLGYPVAKLPPFVEWRLPWYALWGLILALAAYLLGRQLEISYMMVFANNIMYLYEPLLLLAGLTFVYWQIFFWDMRWMLFLLLVMVIFAFQAIAPVLILLGFLDSVFDMRQKMRKFRQQ